MILRDAPEGRSGRATGLARPSDPQDEGGWMPHPCIHCARSLFLRQTGSAPLKIKAIVHNAEEGGYWAEIPANPGCVTQGETMEELVSNLHEAIIGCLSADIGTPQPGRKALILDIAE